MRTPLSTKFEAALFGSLTKKQGTAEDKKRAAGVMAARSAAIADSATGDELDAEAKKGTKKAIDTIRGILSGVAGAEEAILHLDLAAAAVGSGDRAAVVEHLEEVSEALGGEDEETEKVSGGPGEHSQHPYPSETGGGKADAAAGAADRAATAGRSLASAVKGFGQASRMMENTSERADAMRAATKKLESVRAVLAEAGQAALAAGQETAGDKLLELSENVGDLVGHGAQAAEMMEADVKVIADKLRRVSIKETRKSLDADPSPVAKSALEERKDALEKTMRLGATGALEKVSGGPGEHSRHPYPSEQGGGKSEGGGAETGASPEKIRAKLTSSLDQLGQAHGKALQRLDPKDEIGFAFNEVARKDPATKGAAREFNAGLKEQRAKLKERHKELGNRARKVGMAEDEIMFVALDQIDHLSTSIADAGDDSGSGVTLIGQGKSLVRDYERAAKTLDKVEQRVARREQRK